MIEKTEKSIRDKRDMMKGVVQNLIGVTEKSKKRMGQK